MTLASSRWTGVRTHPRSTHRPVVGGTRAAVGRAIRWSWETTNFTDKVNDRGLTVFGTSKNGHLVERFTRVDEDTIDYQITVDDPTVFTRPWTAEIPMTKTEDPLFDYACHEGNHALPHILSGARAQEKAAEEAKKKGLR